MYLSVAEDRTDFGEIVFGSVFAKSGDLFAPGLIFSGQTPTCCFRDLKGVGTGHLQEILSSHTHDVNTLAVKIVLPLSHTPYITILHSGKVVNEYKQKQSVRKCAM